MEFRERATKTRTGENSDTRERPPRAYENKKKPERCPVELYYIYESHRPVSTLNEHAPFYLSVNNMLKDLSNGRSWFKISAIGVNTIGAFLRKMSKGAGVVGRYTNHTARKTLITNLIQAGYPPTMIQQISGHKDVKSISHYATASREQIAQMNDILSNPEQITSRPVVAASGSNIPVSNAPNPGSNAQRTGAISSGANIPISQAPNPGSNARRTGAIASGENISVSHASYPDSNDENTPPSDENLAVSVVMQSDTGAFPGLVPLNRANSDNSSSSSSTMMMARTTGLFHNATFHGCSFTMSFGK